MKREMAREALIADAEESVRMKTGSSDRTKKWAFIDYHIYDLKSDPDKQNPLVKLMDKDIQVQTQTRSRDLEFNVVYQAEGVSIDPLEINIAGHLGWNGKFRTQDDFIGSLESKDSTLINVLDTVMSFLPKEFQNILPFDYNNLMKQNFTGLCNGKSVCSVESSRGILAKDFTFEFSRDANEKEFISFVSLASLIIAYQAKDIDEQMIDRIFRKDFS